MSRTVHPIKAVGPVLGARRTALLADCARLQAELEVLDAELLQLASRRKATADALDAGHRRLTTTVVRRGRLPLPLGGPALPPALAGATPLEGRELRAHCRSLLVAAGEPLTLVELHRRLHLYGHEVASGEPGRALADAMAYEVRAGRLRRTARGTYAAPPP